MFLLKKIISQLFMPIPLTVLLLVVALFFIRRQWRVKLLMIVAIGLLVVLCSRWGSLQLTVPLESQYPVNNTPITQPCVVMVLGSGHDSSVSNNAVQQLSSTALARLTEGVRQLHLGEDCRLVVSGWSGADPLPHAQVMTAAAASLGVDKSNIIQFPQAMDTLEEAQLLKQMIGAQPFRLVTSATHMPRAMMIFEHLGMNPQAAPGDFVTLMGYWWRLDAWNLYVSQKAIHEYVGQLWLRVKFTLLDENTEAEIMPKKAANE